MKYLAFRRPNLPLTPLIKGLGWFSLALGMAELLAPRQVSRGAGIRRNDTLLQSFGLREIVTGIGILAAANPRPWLWGRVAGDVLDAATVAATAKPNKPARLGISSALLIGAGLLDVYTSLRSAPKRPRAGARTGLKDYSRRSGFPRPPEQMRGRALKRAAQRPNAQRPHAAE
jgi:hypothetical protein